MAGQLAQRRVHDTGTQCGGPRRDLGALALETVQPVRDPFGPVAVAPFQGGGLGQEADAGWVVRGCLQLRRPPGQRVELGQELVFVAGAVIAEPGQPPGLGDQVGDLHRGQVGCRGEKDPGLEQVPVIGELPGHRSQVLQPHPGGHGQQQRRREPGVVEQRGAQHRPPVVEGDAGGHFVAHLDQRWQAGLDRVLAENPFGEGVQGADGGRVEIV